MALLSALWYFSSFLWSLFLMLPSLAMRCLTSCIYPLICDYITWELLSGWSVFITGVVSERQGERLIENHLDDCRKGAVSLMLPADCIVSNIVSFGVAQGNSCINSSLLQANSCAATCNFISAGISPPSLPLCPHLSFFPSLLLSSCVISAVKLISSALGL